MAHQRESGIVSDEDAEDLERRVAALEQSVARIGSIGYARSSVVDASRGMPVAMKCPNCNTAIAPHLRTCPGCNSDVGFPNVRLALVDVELSTLDKRLRVQETLADARHIRAVLDNFGLAMLNSKAVMARSLAAVENLIKSDNALIVSYHKQIASGSRLPEINDWDSGRIAAESTILPNFYQEINFAALTLDGRGHPAFGPYFVLLKDEMIAHRSTVFEENPFSFCIRHKVFAGKSPPPGYRAVWEDRSKLAKAKLQPKLRNTTVKDEYPQILMQTGARTSDGDYIEVHIYGPIHRAAIDRVIGPRPRRGSDLAIWKSIERNLRAIGAQLEEA